MSFPTQTSLTMKRNPSATFIRVHTGTKQVLALVDTGATLCFAKKETFSKWTKLKEPKVISVADKSRHYIWWFVEMQPLYINNHRFIAKSIYQHDSGLDLVIGNNFLKLYQPFTQALEWIKLRLTNRPKKDVKIPIVPYNQVLMMLYGKEIVSILNQVIEKVSFYYVHTIDHQIEEKLKMICGDHPLDPVKNQNEWLIEIKLKDPNVQVKVPNRIPYSVEDFNEFSTECKDLMEKGLIRNSYSPHCAPAFYVQNHNEIKRNKRRMVINYKEMNKNIVLDSYRIPRKDYIQQRIKGTNWYSCLDAKSGFWQLRLSEASKPLTAFSVPGNKLYEWNVLPFGIAVAPPIYQRYMDDALAGLESFCIAYIDDILVYTKNDRDDHAKHLIIVLDRLREKGIVISEKKAQILKEEITFLGDDYGKGGIINLAPHTKEKIYLFPDQLENQNQIQKFLGCLGYIAGSGYLANFANDRKLLQLKLKKDQKWNWTKEDTEAVRRLKNNLTNLPQLYNCTINDYLVVETDASNDTWAGCLRAVVNGKKKYGMNELGEFPAKLMLTDEGCHDPHLAKVTSNVNRTSSHDELRGDSLDSTQPSSCGSKGTFYVPNKETLVLCKYISGTFNAAERNYPVHEREALACLRVLDKWKLDLMPTYFELRTDSTYVAGLSRYKIPQANYRMGRIVRWQIQLQQYKPRIKWISTNTNVFADALTKEWSQNKK